MRPKCGRLVAFSSGKENPHGVWAVSRGRRCAIALWYTHSQEHAEQVKDHAGETYTSTSKLDRIPWGMDFEFLRGAAACGCSLTSYLVEGSDSGGSYKREGLQWGWMDVAKTRSVLSAPVSRSEILAERDSYHSSLWLQERVKAEKLMEQRAAEQNKPDGEEYQGADHSSRSSSESLTPDGRAGPVSRRHKPGSDRMQQPKQTRARDEF